MVKVISPLSAVPAPKSGWIEQSRSPVASSVPLKIAAKVDKADRAYHESRIKPLLQEPHVQFIGEIGNHDKGAFYGGAIALLFPIDWSEPFGLVVIEAMANGTQ